MARLGVISHVAELAGPLQEVELVEPVQEEPEVKGNEEETEKKVWKIKNNDKFCINIFFILTKLEIKKNTDSCSCNRSCSYSQH